MLPVDSCGRPRNPGHPVRTENRVRAGGASFDRSLQDLKEREKEKSGRFQQAVAEEKARKALLGKKFQELRKEADETPTERPLRPFDLD